MNSDMQPAPTPTAQDAAKAFLTRKVNIRQLSVPMWGVTIASVAILLFCCIAVSAVGNTTSTANTTLGKSTATHATNTPRATVTPKPHRPTATVASDIVLATGGTATLGGTADAFTAKWGAIQQNLNGVVFSYNRQCGAAGQAYCESITLNQGVDGKFYVALITLSTADTQSRDSTTAHAVCGAYVPADSQFTRDVAYVPGNSTTGDDRIYHSDSLAQRFTADQFVDGNQNPITPGTFDILYYYVTANDDSQISDCQIAIGTS